MRKNARQIRSKVEDVAALTCPRSCAFVIENSEEVESEMETRSAARWC